MINEIEKSTREHMEKTLEALGNEFLTVRTGRASAAILDRVMVDYYGTSVPVTQIAGVKSPDAHLLVIEPWDKGALGPIEHAIQAANLGISPSNDGMVIRLPFPAPTEERRLDLVKQCKQMAEEARIAIRNIRRDANSKIEAAKKDSEISEDDMHRGEDSIQKITDSYVEKIDEALKAKEAEVMEV